jgi:hypothetical protein
MKYHMLFGYHGDSGDGVVPLPSQLRSEAQDEAGTIRGFDETHTGILASPEAIRYLNRLLATE